MSNDTPKMGTFADINKRIAGANTEEEQDARWLLLREINEQGPELLDAVFNEGTAVFKTPIGTFRITYDDVKDVFAWVDWMAQGNSDQGAPL